MDVSAEPAAEPAKRAPTLREAACIALSAPIGGLVAGAIAYAQLSTPPTQSLEDLSNGFAQTLGAGFFGLLGALVAWVAASLWVKSRRTRRGADVPRPPRQVGA